ncbi:hypothetical protein [Seinonella peptonophila]|uniref:hypothetical protein n=1 Tax=Seinonella peptonophila TaxID=112248 RepID=UPI00093492A8|nr:hypothetical protein [Seinonella peptonophila]
MSRWQGDEPIRCSVVHFGQDKLHPDQVLYAQYTSKSARRAEKERFVFTLKFEQEPQPVPFFQGVSFQIVREIARQSMKQEVHFSPDDVQSISTFKEYGTGDYCIKVIVAAPDRKR